jgi:hypothetical protein
MRLASAVAAPTSQLPAHNHNNRRNKRMRRLNLIGVGILAILALSGLASATAFAANPEFLPTTGQKFTITSGKGELVSGFAIKCNKDKGTGEITGAKTVTANVDFEECTVFGVAANSLGDPSKTILVKATGELCYINEAAKEVGVYFTPEPVHIEVPLVGELDVVSGTAVAKAEPINKKSKTGKQVFPSTAIASCGGKTAALKSEKQENGKPESATEVSTEEVTFEKEVEIMA